MEPNQFVIQIDAPRVELDEETGLYSACLKEFPQISATGETAAQAEKHLLELVPILISENATEVLELFIKRYLNSTKPNTLNARIVENDHRRVLELANV